MKKKILDEKILINLYVKKSNSIKDISKILKVHKNTVTKNLKIYGIKIRQRGKCINVWNKNLTKDTDVRIKGYGKKISKANKGKISPNKGKIFSKEWRKNISLGHKGLHNSPKTEFKKGRIPWNKNKRGLKGHPQTEETKRKLSVAHKGKPKPWLIGNKNGLGSIAWNKNLIGYLGAELHWNWQGGKTLESYPSGWTETLKELIRLRDNYKCQLCDKTQKENGKRLSVHHIDYDKDNLTPINLLSLCTSCHGKTNAKRLYWTKFLNEKMRKRKC